MEYTAKIMDDFLIIAIGNNPNRFWTRNSYASACIIADRAVRDANFVKAEVYHTGTDSKQPLYVVQK